MHMLRSAAIVLICLFGLDVPSTGMKDHVQCDMLDQHEMLVLEHFGYVGSLTRASWTTLENICHVNLRLHILHFVWVFRFFKQQLITSTGHFVDTCPSSAVL